MIFLGFSQKTKERKDRALRTPGIASDFRDFALRLRVRWKIASDLRFRVAISEAKTPSFCGISGDLAPSTRKVASDCDCAILVRSNDGGPGL